MRYDINKNLIFIFLSLILLTSCSQKNNFDIDLSNLPKPKKVNDKKKISENSIKPKGEIFLKDLIALKNKEQILSKFKYGKKNPFSEGDITINNLNSDFKLNGFLNTKDKKFVFVSYKDKEGTITEESIGGVNTDLLPNGAKVISIDPKSMKLTINFDDEKFVFEL